MRTVFATAICILTLTNGCIAPPIGKVHPVPEGCLFMQFFSASDDSRCKRNESGQIRSVVTPIDRIEQLQRQWTWEAFEAAIAGNDRSGPDANHLPGPVAWRYVKQHLRPGDEIWTFGILDTGFVVLREGRLFCMVVTNHQL
jgi:hypothetical protein